MTDTTKGRRTEYVPLDTVQGAEQNPKDHDGPGIERSIGRFGVAELPLLDERTGRLVAGHGRIDQLRAMRDAGQKPPDGVQLAPDGAWLVPVNRGWSSRSDAEASAYLVASNRLTERGGWDDEGLGALLARIGEADPELVEIAGFDPEEMAKLLDAEPEPSFQPDDDGDQPRLDQRNAILCPKCAFEWRVGPRGEVEPV